MRATAGDKIAGATGQLDFAAFRVPSSA